MAVLKKANNYSVGISKLMKNQLCKKDQGENNIKQTLASYR